MHKWFISWWRSILWCWEGLTSFCVFSFRLYRQQLPPPAEEDARLGAALRPPPSIPGKATSPRLWGFQYTWSPGGTTSLSQSSGQYGERFIHHRANLTSRIPLKPFLCPLVDSVLICDTSHSSWSITNQIPHCWVSVALKYALAEAGALLCLVRDRSTRNSVFVGITVKPWVFIKLLLPRVWKQVPSYSC